jgi:hypothetical protein
LNSTNAKSLKEKSSKSSSIYSPTKHSSKIASNNLNYHTKSDYNSIVDKKFYDEACEIMKKSISNKPSNLSSTNRTNSKAGVRNRTEGPYNNNNSNLFSSSINFATFNDKKPSESVISEMIDSQYSRYSPERKKFYIEKSKLVEKRSDCPEKFMVEEDKTVNLSFNGDFPQEILQEAFESFYYYIGKEFDTLQKSEKIDRAIDSRYNCRKTCR